MSDRLRAVAVGMPLLLLIGCGGQKLPRESPRAAVRVMLGQIASGRARTVCAGLSHGAARQFELNATSTAVGRPDVPGHLARLNRILQLGRTCVGAVALTRENLGQAGIRALERQLLAHSTRVVVSKGITSIDVAGGGGQDWGLVVSQGQWQIVLVNALSVR